MGTSMHYVGFDIHKKTIAYCVKTKGGKIRDEGEIPATRKGLKMWCEARSQAWCGAMEATLFTGWIYDELKPRARSLKVAHPAMLKALSASKKKNDRVDAALIADMLRADLLPECHMPDKLTRKLRRKMRFRRLIVNNTTQMKNKIAGLLMEIGAEYDSRKLHGKRYFYNLLGDAPYLEDVLDLLGDSRSTLEFLQTIERQLIHALCAHPHLKERVELLMTIPGVGRITALTWALEIGDVRRFASRNNAISYCGLCSAQDSSGGKDKRGPISKKRNKHLQSALIEAANLGPRNNPALKAVYERELQRGNKNRATLAVARKLVGYLLAVDRSGKPFELREPEQN